MYQGHLPDGSSVQKHSAGGCYPYVIFARQFGDQLCYGVMKPDGTEIQLVHYRTAVFAAECLKAEHGRPHLTLVH